MIRIGKTSVDTPGSIQPLIEVEQLLKFIVGCEHDSEIVHIHTSSYWSFARILPYVFLVRSFSNAKLIIHIHSGQFKEWFECSPRLLRSIVKSTLRSADRVIVTSSSWIKIMNELDGKLSRISSLPNGFNSEIFHPSCKLEARKSLGLPADKKVLLTIGHLVEVKGHRYLIEAMTEVKKRRDDVILVIIGTGALKKQLTALVSELRLNNVFFIEDRKTPQEIAIWMNSADLFVLPSLHEGNPTVMFESLGCGKPFVGTRVGGIPDVITSEKVGLVCEPGDSVNMAEAIVAALDKTWDEDYISAYAQQFTWDTISLRLLEIYKQTLAEDYLPSA